MASATDQQPDHSQIPPTPLICPFELMSLQTARKARQWQIKRRFILQQMSFGRLNQSNRSEIVQQPVEAQKKRMNKENKASRCVQSERLGD